MILKNSIEKLVKEKKVIGTGARRVVYNLGNGNVLKVAKTKYGAKSNNREVITYHSSPTPIRKHLARIINYGNECSWLVMEKHIRNFPKTLEYKRKLYDLRSIFRENGIIPYEVVNRHGRPNYQNLRIKKNGEIVVIDYGNFRFLRKNNPYKGDGLLF